MTKRKKSERKTFPVADNASFAVIRAAFQSAIDTRTCLECPLCSQTVKLYKRTIHGKMVEFLVRLYHVSNTNNNGWVNVEELYGPGLSGDYAKLKFWDLIEPHDVRTIERNASGHWRITKKGKAWVEGSITLPKYAYVFNNQCFGLNGPQMTIQQCYGKPFDYRSQVWDDELPGEIFGS